MNIIEKILGRENKGRECKISYSQCGEDLIIDFLFGGLKVTEVSYLDIGAYHPTELSNTYLFYQRGHHGVCVEPDPSLFVKLKRERSRDTCLNIGVGVGEESVADFYVMTSKTLNTFSRAEAERYQSYGDQRIEAVIQVPLVPINAVIEQYFASPPNLVSLDIEGLDLAVLKTFDFNRYRPEIFCIETLTYTEDKTERKVVEIIDFMASKGYFNFADTYINTIFVSRDAWLGR